MAETKAVCTVRIKRIAEKKLKRFYVILASDWIFDSNMKRGRDPEPNKQAQLVHVRLWRCSIRKEERKTHLNHLSKNPSEYVLTRKSQTSIGQTIN